MDTFNEYLFQGKRKCKRSDSIVRRGGQELFSFEKGVFLLNILFICFQFRLTSLRRFLHIWLNRNNEDNKDSHINSRVVVRTHKSNGTIKNIGNWKSVEYNGIPCFWFQRSISIYKDQFGNCNNAWCKEQFQIGWQREQRIWYKTPPKNEQLHVIKTCLNRI